MENKVFALEPWKEKPLPSEQSGCPQHQLPEGIPAGIFFYFFSPPSTPLTYENVYLEQLNQRIKSESRGYQFAKCKFGLNSMLQTLQGITTLILARWQK